MTPEIFKCPRRVGFLFPHECERLTPVGCPDCQNGQITDPYHDRRDRYDYDSGYDFTEADGEHLVKPRKAFEEDPYES